MTSPLFRQVQRALEEAARRDASLRQLGNALSSLRSPTARNVMRGAKQLMSETHGMNQVERYGRVSDFVRTQIIDEVIRQLGPLGSLVSAMLRPSGRSLTDSIQQEMEAASDLLNYIQHGAQIPARPAWLPQRSPSPSPSPGGNTGGRPPRSIGIGAAADQPPPPPRSDVPEGQTSRQVIGRRYQFNDNDPIVTGEMIDVVSSNVHSIGYEWNESEPSRGTLKVRFLEHTGRKNAIRAAGPLYFYFNVHPEVFMAFQAAASKGRFVWDRLRVRGTVSGSRYHYELEDLGSTDYVPRKATRLGQNEYFLRREFTHRQTGQVNTSRLEDEFVQRIGLNRHGPQGFVPMRGRPNRGRP